MVELKLVSKTGGCFTLPRKTVCVCVSLSFSLYIYLYIWKRSLVLCECGVIVMCKIITRTVLLQIIMIYDIQENERRITFFLSLFISGYIQNIHTMAIYKIYMWTEHQFIDALMVNLCMSVNMVMAPVLNIHARHQYISKTTIKIAIQAIIAATWMPHGFLFVVFPQFVQDAPHPCGQFPLAASQLFLLQEFVLDGNKDVLLVEELDQDVEL